MQTNVEMKGKKIAVEITRRALAALQHRTEPLLAEMELYFSCLVRKELRFHDDSSIRPWADGETLPITENLLLAFRPVMTKVCGKDFEGSEPPLTDFPVQNIRAYIPAWVKIDFAAGQWRGDFGYLQDPA